MSIKVWILTGLIGLAGGTGIYAVQEAGVDSLQDAAPAMRQEMRVNFGQARQGDALRLGDEARDFLKEAVQEASANALGLTVEEFDALRNDRESRQQLPALLEEANLTSEEFRTIVSEALDTAVQEALDSELITAEQATQIQEHGLHTKQRGQHHHGRNPLQGIFSNTDRQEVIAEALGISVEELEAAHADGLRLTDIATQEGVNMDEVKEAIEAGMVAVIEQAVVDGDLSQERADQILEKMAVSQIQRDIMHQALADALGISTEQLDTYRAEGTDLRDIVTDLGLDEEQVREDVMAAREAGIQQAVEDGTLTQEQADQLLNGRQQKRGFRGQDAGRRNFDNAPQGGVFGQNFDG